MELLLDTDALLFSLTGDKRLGKRARALLEDPGNRFRYSSLSVWEVAIWHARDPDGVPVDASRFKALCELAGAEELPFTAAAAALLGGAGAIAGADAGPGAGGSPPSRLVADVFDQGILCQARASGLTLMTCDARLLGTGAAMLVGGRE